jgi:GDP-L-fucose synthase
LLLSSNQYQRYDLEVRILVLGSKGLVGSAVCRELDRQNREFFAVSRSQANLMNPDEVLSLFGSIKPDAVIGAAAKVGGMIANKTYPVEFLIDNLTIQNNMLQAAHKHNVGKLILLGSSCIYPAHASQPISEDSLLTGILESSNEAYAIAKIAGVKLIQAFRDEYQKNWVSVMPTNWYGPEDNFDLKNSHVLAAFIRKFYEAEKFLVPSIELWGSGNPRREFMHVDDFASALIFVLDNYNEREPINIGTGNDISILELAEIMVKLSNFKGEIKWNTSVPDGTYRKLLNVEKLNKLGWKSRINLEDGLNATYKWFAQNYEKTRLEVPISSQLI